MEGEKQRKKETRTEINQLHDANNHIQTIDPKKEKSDLPVVCSSKKEGGNQL